MADRSKLQVGLAAIGFAAFLFLVGIPFGVTSPSNVSKIVLSPVFWPNVLAALLALAGLGLVLSARLARPVGEEAAPDAVPGGWLRLAAMAVIMLLYVGLAAKAGLVWMSMLAFAAMAFLIRTRHRVAAAIAALLVPLVLYAFFAHVAGVAVPQGVLVRLP